MNRLTSVMHTHTQRLEKYILYITW